MVITFSESIHNYINNKIVVDQKKVFTYSQKSLLKKINYNYEKKYSEYLNKYIIANISPLSDTPGNQLDPLYVTFDNTTIQYAFIMYDMKNNPIWACIGPCIMTNYSEYRTSVIEIDKVSVPKKFKPIYSKIRDFIEKNIQSKNIILSSSLNKRDFLKSTFIISILYHLYDRNNWNFYNYNCNPIYMKLLDSIIYPIRSYSKIYKKDIDAIIKSLYTKIGSSFLEFGCKMTPIYFEELKNIHDLTIPLWRNIYVNNIINYIITSGISDNFLLSFGWRFIYHHDINVYTNHIISDKFRNSEQVYAISKAHILLLDFLEENKETLNMNINAMTKIKKNLIENASELKKIDLLSTYSVFEMYENKDNTLYNYFYNLITYDIQSIIVDIITNHNVFKKFLFEVSYALWTIHSNGIIHNDLHANNIIIDIFNNRDTKNTSNIYVIDDNYEYIYIVPNYAFSTHLIDFDRSILSESHLSTTDLFVEEIVYELSQFMPSIKTDKSIQSALKNTKNYPILFKIYTAFDFLKIVSILLNLFTTDSIRNQYNKNKEYSNTIKLLKKIHKESVRYIKKIIDISTFSKPLEEEWFSYRILKTHFREFRVAYNRLESYADDTFYRYFDIYANNPIQYSILTFYDQKHEKEFKDLNRKIAQLKKKKEKFNQRMDEFIDSFH